MRRAARRLLASLAVIAAPACGLLGADPEPTPLPSDGVNDFGDATPIEVCVGSARAVSPSVVGGLAGALCVDEGRTAAPCADDTACDGIERCVCGRCVVEACQGSSCDDGRVCRDGRCTYPCATDGDCAAGETCATGGCARTCGADGDCHYGERCDSLFEACGASVCSDAIPCAPGSTCEGQVVVTDLREPFVAADAPAAYAFVELRASTSDGIARARIDDTTHWSADPTDPVVRPDAAGGVSAPTALVSGDHVDLWFGVGDGAGIGHATSEDGGRTFTRASGPLTLSPAAPWELGWVGSPSVVVFQGRTLLFYEGGPRVGIGVAEIVGERATRVIVDPIATPLSVTDVLLWRGVTEVRAPHAVVLGDVLRVYFTGRGVEGTDATMDAGTIPADANDSIGMIATRDVLTWDVSPTGPVFSRQTNIRGWLGESEASVTLAPTGASIVFVSADATGKNTNGLAQAGAQ